MLENQNGEWIWRRAVWGGPSLNASLRFSPSVFVIAPSTTDKAALFLARMSLSDVDLIHSVHVLCMCGTHPPSCLQKVKRITRCPWCLRLSMYTSVWEYKPGLTLTDPLLPPCTPTSSLAPPSSSSSVESYGGWDPEVLHNHHLLFWHCPYICEKV